jgi:hypothetical protein
LATAPIANPEAALAQALAVLARHGWAAGDLDYLLYEGQAQDHSEGDPEFDAAIGILGRLREAGVHIG